MKEEEIIQAGIDYTLSTNPRCIAGNAFADIANMMNRNPSFEAGAKWMQEKIIEKAGDWLSNMSIEDMIEKYDEFDTSEGWYKFIDDLKKAMKQ